MTNFKAPWKAFKADGKHLIDDKWHATHESNHSTIHAPVKNARGATVALVVAHGHWIDLPDIEPVCRLISAAPDLLAALQAVVKVADRKTVEFDLAHAAIAKATGEAA